MRRLKDSWVIHLFALLHAAVAFGCRVYGIADDLMLTLLTMLLVVFLCLRRQSGVLFLAATVVLVNIVGYLLGTGLAALLNLMRLSPVAAHPLATFISTEVIGWSTLLAVRGFRRRNPTLATAPDSRGLRFLLLALVAIIVLRMLLILFSSGIQNSRNFVIGLVLDYIFTILSLVWVAEYAIRAREEAEKASEEANLARYRYLQLKQQVDPHFLFNSLNVLDCLIQDQPREDASRYTHKLAEIYRYMLKNDERTTVRLRDELGFVAQYVDLLLLRFQEGLEVHVDVPEEMLSRSVVPCCVQLLIENATKHNAVRAENPLRIDIRLAAEGLEVTNNLCPRLTPAASTGLGLKYIRQQYEDIAGKGITIRQSDAYYTVILPLL